MKAKQVTLVLLIAELIIPVLGYFFWNWDYSFILLFYAFDWVFLLIFQGIKIRKRLQLSNSVIERNNAIRGMIIYVCSFIISCGIILFVSDQVDPGFDFSNRFNAFMRYKDMGFEQAYIIVPLCFLNAYNAYKRQFVFPNAAERFTISQIIGLSLVQHIILTVAVIVISTVVLLGHLSPNIFLISCVFGVFAGKAYFQLYKTKP